MIILRNTQRCTRIPTRLYRQHLTTLLSATPYKDWDLGVQLTGDRLVRKLNKQYRGKDEPTDILSIPFSQVSQLYYTWALT